MNSCKNDSMIEDIECVYVLCQVMFLTRPMYMADLFMTSILPEFAIANPHSPFMVVLKCFDTI